MINSIKKIFISVSIIGIFLIAIFGMKVQHVKIEGNSRLSDIEVASAIFNEEIDKNALVLYIKEKMGIHKKINYINDYYISWESPFNITIFVHEKPSIAYVRSDLKNVYFDKDGIINDITEEKKDDIVEITGITFKSYEKGHKIEARDMKTINAILNITKSLYDNKLPASYLDISKKGDISVFVGNITVVLGDAQNMEIKLQRLCDIYKEIKDLKGTLYLSNARENMLDEQYIFKKSE